MGWFEDFEKALSGLIDFLEDNDIPFEIIGEDDIEDEPEVGIFHSSTTEEEDEDEEWWEYYVSIDSGYFGNDERGYESQVYYSQSPNKKVETMERFVGTFGDRYVGKGNKIEPSVYVSEVGRDEVDFDRVID